MEGQPDYLNPTTNALLWISGVLAIPLTLDRYGDGGFLEQLIDRTGDVVITGAVTFAILYGIREIIKRSRVFN